MPDRRELRIGLVLNGGVSLAVWISGVVHEIDGCVAATGPYAEALAANGYDGARVDVIAGASAGGINGALLAVGDPGLEAAALRRPAAARRVAGDRRPGEAHAQPARTGAAFDPARRRVLPAGVARGARRAPRPGGARRRLRHPLYLFLTATDVRGTRNARLLH